MHKIKDALENNCRFFFSSFFSQSLKLHHSEVFGAPLELIYSRWVQTRTLFTYLAVCMKSRDSKLRNTRTRPRPVRCFNTSARSDAEPQKEPGPRCSLTCRSQITADFCIGKFPLCPLWPLTLGIYGSNTCSAPSLMSWGSDGPVWTSDRFIEC